MSMPYFGASHAAQTPELHSGNVSLVIRQEPKTALVTLSKKEKNRKPIDPPPIVQMHVHDHNVETSWLVSPYLFLIATLLSGERGDDVLIGDQYVIGQSSSSLNRLKDVDNKDGGFFVFGDISVRKTGWYRLRFSLFNQNNQKRGYQSVESSPAVSTRHGGAPNNEYGHGGPVLKRQRTNSDYDPSNTTYGRVPAHGYAYSGSNMTPGEYNVYPVYESQSHAFHQEQDYGGVALQGNYHASSHTRPNHYSINSRPAVHDVTSTPTGAYPDPASKHPSLEQTSYFSGYPTPTRNGSFTTQLQIQSSDLYAHTQPPQQQHFIPSAGGYGFAASSTQVAHAVDQRPKLTHGTPMHNISSIRQPPPTSSQPYTIAMPAVEPLQTFRTSTSGGYSNDTLLYPTLDTRTATGAALPSTPLTSSTLNSAYTAQYCGDANGQPPDEQQAAVGYTGPPLSLPAALGGIYDTR
ncbi:hypothetical protein LTR35_009281 [Friedmanniomyces endolithicus]|uniref:Velvet domain-containing protein n=1 Tax=Friedmanniomyces endolithicus TaxID=329885 RepID=A0AAN6FN09_9PEZI|nr:hypothetical protein LTR35_009281 [Friedmanniomyces endolithicus]KAK0292341.1 hypothetical protein LTS00_008176 [Friedmanniomyces endolithicus]KAK0320337.1 hypothetical protein LTR82_008854 [Friedmanniomyces endolithicus]KAK0993715.1 hypothetical protein LTR54_011007 [Friedmanniomyces endolithicus]